MANLPEIYRFMSWHLKGPYTRAMLADTLWGALVKECSHGDIKAALETPSKEHTPIQKVWRAICEFPDFNEYVTWKMPNPQWVGEQLQVFLKHYLTIKPNALREIEPKPEQVKAKDSDDLFDEEPQKQGRKRGIAQPRNAAAVAVEI